MMPWDEAKRQENLRKHGFDFVGCDAVFDHPLVAWEDDREVYGEQRLNDLPAKAGRLSWRGINPRLKRFAADETAT